MSFPYCVDLAFGSEKPTADPYSHNSFGAGKGGKSGLPKTQEELDEAIQSGLAYQVSTEPLDSSTVLIDFLDDPPYLDTLPDNLKGVVALVLSEEEEGSQVVQLDYEITSTDPLQITAHGASSDDSVYIILKQAID